jgi:hypothetical protein
MYLTVYHKKKRKLFCKSLIFVVVALPKPSYPNKCKNSSRLTDVNFRDLFSGKNLADF